MKRLIASLLLISLLFSLCLVPVSAADTVEPIRVRDNAALGATYKSNVSIANKVGLSGSANIVDGVISHDPNNSSTFLNWRVGHTGYALNYQDDKMPANKYSDIDRYDINGTQKSKTDPECKYLSIVEYEMTEMVQVSVARIYLDDVDDDGNPSKHMLDGVEIAVSETGAADSWTVVLSAEKINCEKNFQISEDKFGNKTAYVEASFAPIKAKYFRIGVTESSCRHQPGLYADGNENWLWCRITEVELLGPEKLVLPDGATWSEEAVDYSTDNAYVSNTVNIETTSNRPFSQYFDKTIDNAFKEGATTMHYVDSRLTDNSINTPDGQRYDLTGNLAAADETHKYLGYLDIDLHKVQYIDNIKVYLDALDMSANYPGDGLLINGFDLLVSETGKDGSWKTVYSETGIRDEDKYELRDNLGNNLNGERAKQAWIDVNFDITPARYVRFALTESRDTTKYFRITQFEVFGHDFIPPVEEEVDEETEEPAINSLMLFPLLMRHRQYETETSTTMFGLRVKHLLRSADAITFEKNGIQATIPADALKALKLAGSDKLVVTITGTEADTATVTVTVNGKAVDTIEGITITKG